MSFLEIVHWEQYLWDTQETLPGYITTLLPLSYGGNIVQRDSNIPNYIHNLNKKFDIITAMIIFLFPFLKVEAKLGACLPSFLPGGKLCGRVINTLMDPAGTVSCNLICKEIIWVIDGDKQFLLDGALYVWLHRWLSRAFFSKRRRDDARTSRTIYHP